MGAWGAGGSVAGAERAGRLDRAARARAQPQDAHPTPAHTLTPQNTIAFFHPNAAGGGGGERVLWVAVAATMRARPSAAISIYCDAALTPAALAHSARTAFGVSLPRPVSVVPLPDVARLSPSRHPRLTLVTQSAAGGALAWAGYPTNHRGTRRRRSCHTRRCTWA